MKENSITIILEERADGFYATFTSKAGPCPIPPCKVRGAKTLEEAQEKAQELLAGLQRTKALIGAHKKLL